MPISSGANNWPKTYWSRPPKRPGVHSRVIVVDRPDPPELKGPSAPASPQVTYRSPSPPPLTHDRTPTPPPSPRQPSVRRIIEERIHYDNPPPPRDPPTPPPQLTRTVTTSRTLEQRPPPPRTFRTRFSRYGTNGRYGESYGPGYERYQYGYNYGQRDQYDSSCCGNHMFNSGKAGGDTGCCQGGLFSNKVSQAGNQHTTMSDENYGNYK